MNGIKIVLSFFVCSFLFSCSKYSKILKSKDYQYKLEMADKYYVAKNYANAQQLYEELYPIYKGTDKFEDIYYKDAYCFYYLESYKDAENFFKGFLDVFPNSPKAEEIDYMRAFCYYKQSPKVELDQTNTTKAIGIMQTFISTHPNSTRIKEATEIIDKCRNKLEIKDAKAADLYYKIGHYRAAAIAYTDILTNYPETQNGDLYKSKAIKAYFEFAKLSVFNKQVERYEKVITEYQDFVDRFPDSKLLKEAEQYSNTSKNNIKEIQDEQTKASTKL